MWTARICVIAAAPARNVAKGIVRSTDRVNA